MSEKKRIKELKRPDTFQTKGLLALDWVMARKGQILAAFIPVVLVVAGVFGWQYYQKRLGDDRREALAQIDHTFSDEMEVAGKKQEEIQKKIEPIEKQLADTKNPPANKADLEKSKKELEDQMGGIKADHDASQEKFLAFYKSNPNNAEGWRAALNVATIYIEHEKFDEARKLLAEILPRATKLPFYNFQVRSVYISLLEQAGDYKLAEEQVEEILKVKDDDQMPKALLMKGRILLLAGEKDRAREIFQKVVNDHNSSVEAQKAKAYSALL